MIAVMFFADLMCWRLHRHECLGYFALKSQVGFHVDVGDAIAQFEDEVGPRAIGSQGESGHERQRGITAF